MDFTNINSALSSFQTIDSTASILGAASLVILAQTLESTEGMNQSMIQMMENSVTPYLGSNIDLYV